MTYRERRERRAARLQEWADKREAKSQAHYEKAHSVASMIPPGQPILVGHHSERGHRRMLQNIDNNMRASIENGKKAESMRNRAANIIDAADHAIYSDDPDVIERLQERVAELEAERDRIKAFNKTAGTGRPDVALLDDRQRKDYESRLSIGPIFLTPGGGLPMTNLSANINRNKKRLEFLKRKAIA